VLCVLCVHFSKVVHVTKEDRSLDDLSHACASSLEDLSNVVENQTSLLGDGASAKLTGGRVQGDLTRSKQHSVCLDCLAVRTDGFGCLVCCNNLLLLFPTAAALVAAAASTSAFTSALLALLASTLAALTAAALGGVAGALAVLAMALSVRTEAGAFALLTAAFLCTFAMAALLRGSRVLSTIAFTATARHVCRVD